MDTGYGCFFDTAMLPWAMFCEREDAITFATAVVAKVLASGGRQCHMRVHFKPSNGPWERKAVWDSDLLVCAASSDRRETEARRIESLRDKFACEAMCQWAPQYGLDNVERCAAQAYQLADAMLAARQPKDPTECAPTLDHAQSPDRCES
ncbi:MAG TPA: hypothetical protein VK540_12770 [Polyangiaceae bacterium]|nr:hypothetical protein [Polyangiaceae bacterium]